jgi:hypothetical protein
MRIGDGSPANEFLPWRSETLLIEGTFSTMVRPILGGICPVTLPEADSLFRQLAKDERALLEMHRGSWRNGLYFAARKMLERSPEADSLIAGPLAMVTVRQGAAAGPTSTAAAFGSEQELRLASYEALPSAMADRDGSGSVRDWTVALAAIALVRGYAVPTTGGAGRRDEPLTTGRLRPSERR